MQKSRQYRSSDRLHNCSITVRTYRDYTLEASIELVEVLEYVLETLLLVSEVLTVLAGDIRHTAATSLTRRAR